MSRAKSQSRHRSFEEAWIFMQMWIPLMLSEYVVFVGDQLTLVLFGHFDSRTDHYAGVAYGRTFLLVTAGAVGTGISMGVPMIVAQNHGRGADNENGWVLWQCTKALLGCFAVAIVGAFFFKPASLALGMPEGAISIGSVYVAWEMVSVPPFWFNIVLESMLAAAGFVGATAGIRSFGSTLNLFITYIFLRFLDLGYFALIYADFIGFWLHTCLLVLFIIRTGKREIIFGMAPPSRDALGNPSITPMSVRAYLWLAAPLAVGCWVESLAGEIMTLFAGWTSGADVSIAAQAVINAVSGVFFFGLGQSGVCLTIRVGQLLGSRDFDGIVVVISTVMELMVFVGGLCAVAVAGGARERLMWVWSNNIDIINAAMTANLAIALSIPIFSVMNILSCSLRIGGRPLCAMVTTVGSTLFVGAPMMYLLGVRANMGLFGNSLGNVVAMTVATVGMGITMCRLDWVTAVAQASGETAEG